MNADDVTHFKLNNLNWGWGILNGILGAKNFLSCQKLILIGQTISLKRNNFYELIYPISEHFFCRTLPNRSKISSKIFFSWELFFGQTGYSRKNFVIRKSLEFSDFRRFLKQVQSSMIEFGTICWK